MSSQAIHIRKATRQDLEALLQIENTCFSTDILSRRSFVHFLRPGAHDLLVADISSGNISAYVLVLYRTGTSLARLYSIAVMPTQQGKGIAAKLIAAAELAAHARHCALMRLEVNLQNQAAINLYRKLGYHEMGKINNYYADGSDALRMEKRIYSGVLKKDIDAPYYQQTTDFTCGPAALMMALKTLIPCYTLSRQEELQIWREATTIFMTSGHGGCSPYGLALSAHQRGARAELYINQAGAPFLDGVRDPDKKAVVEVVHEDFLRQISATGIGIHVQDIPPDKLRKLLRSGHAMIALISTWRLNRNKAPHWVFVAGADQHFVYINDPDTTDAPWQSETDYQLVPINIEEFITMACFGQTRLRALLVLERKTA